MWGVLKMRVPMCMSPLSGRPRHTGPGDSWGPEPSHLLWPGLCLHWAPGEDFTGSLRQVVRPQAATGPHSCRVGQGQCQESPGSRPSIGPQPWPLRASPFPVMTGFPGGQSLSSEHRASGMLSLYQERKGPCVGVPAGLPAPSQVSPRDLGEVPPLPGATHPLRICFSPKTVQAHAPPPHTHPEPLEGTGTPASGDG